jgi:drug/metabolite transporter (DMT)-like permease
VYLIWGSTYLAIRVAVETLPPFLMAGTRFLTAGAILYGALRLRGTPPPRAIEWRTAWIVGALLLVGGNGGVVWAEQRVPSGLAALIVAVMPCWMALLSWRFFGGAAPTRRTVLGLVIGLGGVALLVGPGRMGGASIEADAAAALILASITWAIGSLYARRAPLPASPIVATGMEMLAGGTLLILVGLLRGEAHHLTAAAFTARAVGALGYLIVFGSLGAFTSYVWLLGNTTPTVAASYAYVNPLVAVLLGWALAGEPVSPRTFVAAGVIVVGVFLITWRSRR